MKLSIYLLNICPLSTCIATLSFQTDLILSLDFEHKVKTLNLQPSFPDK